MKRVLLSLIFGLTACEWQVQKPPFTPSAEFNAYWNSGLAELDRYELHQARYGSIHRGEMIAIFVTEPFRTDKQVKSELTPGQNDGSTSLTTNTNVLKVQTTRRFATGIYDYVLTTSAFKPIDTVRFPQALKISGSAVDWCGHSWLQLNLKKNEYRVQSRSYFEESADEDYSVAGALSEDEIWNLIRMQPEKLPRGEIMVIPSLMSQRLRHRRASALKAKGEVNMLASLNVEFSLTYPMPEGRRVAFVFEHNFPHKILEYRETYLDGFGKPRELTTTARLTKSIRTAYWREHDPEHAILRKQFGVTMGGF